VDAISQSTMLVARRELRERFEKLNVPW
jgi:hypothetical protein